jgi:phosphoribosylformylglycinamidine (FGAM) synthase-like enzyme
MFCVVLHSQVYPDNLAPPQQILIDASNGASDYGNKFGEPLIAGYTRTFGQRLPNGERREWLKPIMFRWVGGLRVQVGYVAPASSRI